MSAVRSDEALGLGEAGTRPPSPSLYTVPAPPQEEGIVIRPIQLGIVVYLAFNVAMAGGFATATDIWLHYIWAVFFAVAAVACAVLTYGGSNRWLEPAGALTTTALTARPVGAVYELLIGRSDKTPPRLWLTLSLYLGFAAITALFFVLVARVRED